MSGQIIANKKPFRTIVVNTSLAKMFECVLAEMKPHVESFRGKFPDSHRLGRYPIRDYEQAESDVLLMLEFVTTGSPAPELNNIQLTQLQASILQNFCESVHNEAYTNIPQEHEHSKDDPFWEDLNRIVEFLEITEEECGCIHPPMPWQPFYKTPETAKEIETARISAAMQQLLKDKGFLVTAHHPYSIHIESAFKNVSDLFIVLNEETYQPKSFDRPAEVFLDRESAFDAEVFATLSLLKKAGIDCGRIEIEDRDDHELYELSRSYTIDIRVETLASKEMKLFMTRGIIARPHYVTCTNYWPPETVI